ncbi:EGF-like domain protein [Trichuris suis]|nr:EGF-like domain protein [Trichuris suis]
MRSVRQALASFILYTHAMTVKVFYLFFILCLAYADCHSSFEGSAIVCEPGFTADQCDAVNVPCPDEACKNGGICHGTSSYMRCICPQNWAGPYCDEAVTRCSSDKMCNGLGTCFIHHGQMGCACNWLYDGKHCEIRVKPFGCNRDVCLHGSCIKTEHDVPGCKCFEGFTGSACEIKIPSCKPEVCIYGSCRNLEDGYTCDCSGGAKGKHCDELVQSCDSSPCLNEGTCEGDDVMFHCSCTTDYTGKRCETFIGSQTNSSEEPVMAYMHEKEFNEESEEADIGRIVGICVTIMCTIVLFWWAVIKYRRTRAMDLDLSMASDSDDEENLIDPISVWQGPPPLRWIPISKYTTCKHNKPSSEVVKSSHAMPDDDSKLQRSHSCGPPAVAKEQPVSRVLHRSSSM